MGISCCFNSNRIMQCLVTKFYIDSSQITINLELPCAFVDFFPVIFLVCCDIVNDDALFLIHKKSVQLMLLLLDHVLLDYKTPNIQLLNIMGANKEQRDLSNFEILLKCPRLRCSILSQEIFRII